MSSFAYRISVLSSDTLEDLAIKWSVASLALAATVVWTDHALPKSLLRHTITKTSASICFLVAALLWNAAAGVGCSIPSVEGDMLFAPVQGAYHCALNLSTVPTSAPRAWMFASLALCFVGDVFLCFDILFLPGLISFLIGHGFFAAVFYSRSFSVALAALYGIVPGILIFWYVGTGILPHVKKNKSFMFWPIILYTGVITVMMLTTLGGSHEHSSMVAGAFFVASDIGVARHVFVGYSIVNRLGLMLYYSAVLLFARLLRDPTF